MEGPSHQNTGVCTPIVFKGPKNKFDLASLYQTCQAIQYVSVRFNIKAFKYVDQIGVVTP